MINIIDTIRNKFSKSQQPVIKAEPEAKQASLAYRAMMASDEDAIKGTLTHEVLDAVAYTLEGFIAETRVDGFRSIVLEKGCAECLGVDALRRLGAACMQCHTYAEPVTRTEKRVFALGERLIELASKKEAMAPAEREQFEQAALEELVLLRYRAEQRAAKLAEQAAQAK
jgi:hypothetical protein